MQPLSDIVQFQSLNLPYGKAISGKLEFVVNQHLSAEHSGSIDAEAMAKERILSHMWEELYGDIMKDFQKAIQISRRFERGSYSEVHDFQEMLDTAMKKIRGLR
jgi:hypothetical protein